MRLTHFLRALNPFARTRRNTKRHRYRHNKHSRTKNRRRYMRGG